MKIPITVLLFGCCLTLHATNIGDTTEQVLAEKGKPLSQIEAGNVRILKYSDATIRLKDNAVITITAANPPATTSSSPKPTPTATSAASPASQIGNIKRIRDRALSRVEAIVNQPVETLPRAPGMRVSEHPNGWFHQGAIKPDFLNVDVRATQEKPYDKFPYVTSSLNPGVVFVGTDLEFNPMTKYFYRDYSLPKKKLTEVEMLEINDQYRIIGRCEKQLAELGAQ